MKYFVDSHLREANFQEGYWVIVKLRPYHQSSVTGTTHTKLAKRYYGPFEVLERMSSCLQNSFAGRISHSSYFPLFTS